MSQALPPDFRSLGMDPTAMYYTGMHGNNGLPGGYASSQVRIQLYAPLVNTETRADGE